MSNTPRTDAIRTFQCSPHMPGGWVPAHKYEEMESELTTAIEQRDRLAVALDVCLRPYGGVNRIRLWRGGHRLNQPNNHYENYEQTNNRNPSPPYRGHGRGTFKRLR
jgi:hypothetical protein